MACLVKWPADLPRGAYGLPASTLDLDGTRAAAGVRRGFRGQRELLTYLRGEETATPHEYLFWRALPNGAVRLDKWKLCCVGPTD